jgi:hypothetical protein
LATPLLVDDVYEQWLVGMKLAADASVDLVTRCLQEQWEIRTFPRAICTALVLCYHSLGMGSIHLDHYFPNETIHPMQSMSDKLSTIEAILKELGPSIKVLLCRAQISLEGYKRQLALETLNNDLSNGAVTNMDDLSFLLSPVDQADKRTDTGFMQVFRPDALGLDDWDPLSDWGNGWQWQPTGSNAKNFWDR